MTLAVLGGCDNDKPVFGYADAPGAFDAATDGSGGGSTDGQGGGGGDGQSGGGDGGGGGGGDGGGGGGDGRADLPTDRRDAGRDLPVDRRDAGRDLPVDRRDGARDGNGGGTDGQGGGGDGGGGQRDSATRPDGPAGNDLGVPAVSITSVSPITTGQPGQAYSFRFFATGGFGASSYRWSVTAPWGAIDPVTGVFSGTAPTTAPASYTLVVTVTSGVLSDTQSFTLPVVGTLGPTQGATPAYEHTGFPASLDVGTLVTGGTQPYTCTFYTGAGSGTRPGQLVQNGCVLSGGFAPSDAPGLYGFVVTVRDANGQSTQVRILVRNGSCNTSAVTMTPAEYPLRVVAAGSAYSWSVNATDVDAVCTSSACTNCRACLNRTMGTRSPLSTASQLNCANSGDLCSASSTFSPITSCPSTGSWTGAVNIKAHAPLRSGQPAFVTVNTSMVYSGTVASATACGNKTWSCHWETLEQ